MPSFDRWRFPHGHLPSPWKDLSLDPTVPSAAQHFKSKVAALVRDGTCRISGYLNAVEAAHLVPLTDGDWFQSKHMERYCSLPVNLHPINDERNLVILRRDLHHLLDARCFTFAAKSVSPQLSAVSPTVGSGDNFVVRRRSVYCQACLTRHAPLRIRPAPGAVPPRAPAPCQGPRRRVLLCALRVDALC